MGVYERIEVDLEGEGSLTLGELTDLDTSHAVPRSIHMLAYTGSKLIASADPVQQTGWLIDIRIMPLYVVTRRAQSPADGEQQHKDVL